MSSVIEKGFYLVAASDSKVNFYKLPIGSAYTPDAVFNEDCTVLTTIHWKGVAYNQYTVVIGKGVAPSLQDKRNQVEDIIKNLRLDNGLLQIALDDKTTLLKSCEKALEERDDKYGKLKLAARRLSIEADEFQEGEGDGMMLADAITEVERLTS